MFPTFTSDSSGDLPLPLVVSQQWKFPLQYYLIENQYWFAIQDWLTGLLEFDTTEASKRWDAMKRTNDIESSLSTRSLAYKASDNKIY